MNTERINYNTLNEYARAINNSNGEITDNILSLNSNDLQGLLAEYVNDIGTYDVRITKPVRDWAAERIANHERKRYTDYNGRPLIYPSLHHCHLDYLIKLLLEY